MYLVGVGDSRSEATCCHTLREKFAPTHVSGYGFGSGGRQLSSDSRGNLIVTGFGDGAVIPQSRGFARPTGAS